MFNRKSSYALNKKDPNAIVYMDANEVIIRLTREDFASEKEFLKWKALSDEDYHASEKEAHVYANHTLALDELSEEAASIPAVDVCMEQAHDRVAEIRRSTQKVTQIRKHLTDTQFRRMWMYFVDGMTIDEIGKVEGVSHQAKLLYAELYQTEDRKKCTVCGAFFASTSNSVKYCPDCRKRITRRQAAERMRKRRALVTR